MMALDPTLPWELDVSSIPFRIPITSRIHKDSLRYLLSKYQIQNETVDTKDPTVFLLPLDLRPTEPPNPDEEDKGKKKSKKKDPKKIFGRYDIYAYFAYHLDWKDCGDYL